MQLTNYSQLISEGFDVIDRHFNIPVTSEAFVALFEEKMLNPLLLCKGQKAVVLTTRPQDLPKDPEGFQLLMFHPEWIPATEQRESYLSFTILINQDGINKGKITHLSYYENFPDGWYDFTFVDKPVSFLQASEIRNPYLDILRKSK